MAKAPAEIRSLARSHTETAIKTLAGLMNEKKVPAASRVAAATALLDRGWGKPAQSVEMTGKDGGPIETVDLSKLTDKDLGNLNAILSRAAQTED